MMKLYNDVCAECSKLITNRYSTSFSLGIKSLSKRLHRPIYSIYGYVRFADEIVDTFHDKPKAELLEEFKVDTYKAIAMGISLNPVLNAFQEVVNTYQIDHKLIDAFLKSMEMDLLQTTYDEFDYEKYIYGSAEVVGLMCLTVFCEGDTKQYEQLKSAACKLGSAFQKVNFLRDIKDDLDVRGRIYFPGVEFSSFTQDAKQMIEKDIEQDFKEAYEGIIKLPTGARMGVYLAYVYYVRLFNKIKDCPPEQIKNVRVRVPNGNKIYLLLKSYVKYQLNVM